MGLFTLCLCIRFLSSCCVQWFGMLARCCYYDVLFWCVVPFVSCFKFPHVCMFEGLFASVVLPVCCFVRAFSLRVQNILFVCGGVPQGLQTETIPNLLYCCFRDPNLSTLDFGSDDAGNYLTRLYLMFSIFAATRTGLLWMLNSQTKRKGQSGRCSPLRDSSTKT